MRAVAAQEALDGVRGRRQLVIRAVLPVLLFGVVLGTALVARGPDQRRREAYRVAVEGDLAGARESLDLLPADAMVVEPAEDAASATAEGATIGLVVPDGLDAARAAGEPTNIVVYRAVGSPAARAAVALVVSSFGDADLAAGEAVATAAGGRAERGVAAFGLVDVQLTESGTRELTGGLAPALLTLQAAMLVSGTATHLLSRRRRGLLTAQLLLPLSRWRLALAKLAGEFVVGLVAAAPVLAVILGFVAVVAAGRDGLLAALGAVVACLVGALVLSSLAAAIGLAIGTRARSQEQVSLLTMISLVVFAVAAAFFALGEHASIGALGFVPLGGLVSTLRDLLAGEGSVLWFAVGIASTSLTTAAIVWRTSRHFDAERLVLRSSS